MDAEEIVDRDLGTPSFVSWSARREVANLARIVSHLYPGSDLERNALQALDLVINIDDRLE